MINFMHKFSQLYIAPRHHTIPICTAMAPGGRTRATRRCIPFWKRTQNLCTCYSRVNIILFSPVHPILIRLMAHTY